MAAKTKLVLVIDDDPDFLEFIRIVLESAAYEVMTTTTVEHGLEVMRKQKPDLAIVDIMISYILDGLSLIRRMREDPALAGTPMLLISAIMSIDDLRELPASPSADGFMTKPVDPAELLSEVARLIDRTQKQSEPTEEMKEE